MTLEPGHVVNVDKAARWLGVDARTVRRMCARGQLPGSYQPSGFAGKWLVPTASLARICAPPLSVVSELSDLSETEA